YLIELTLAGALLVPWLGLLPGIPRWSTGWLTLEPVPVVSEAAPTKPDLLTSAVVQTSVAEHDPSVAPPLVDGEKEDAAPALEVPTTEAQAESTLTATPVLPPPMRASTASVAWVILLAYGSIVAALLARMLTGFRYLAWLRREAYPAPPQAADLFRKIAGPAGRRVRLLASDTIELPLTFLGWQPTILLPGGLCRNGDPQALRYS